MLSESGNSWSRPDGTAEFSGWHVSTERAAETTCHVCKQPIGEGQPYFAFGSRRGAQVHEESYSRICALCSAKNPRTPEPDATVLARAKQAQLRIMERETARFAAEQQQATAPEPPQESREGLFGTDDNGIEIK